MSDPAEALASALASSFVRWSFPAAPEREATNPAAMADAWDKAVWAWRRWQAPDPRIRLAIRMTSTEDLAGLIATLAGCMPELVSTHVAVESSPGAGRWGWPLHVGVVNTVEGDVLRASLASDDVWWATRFARLTPAGERPAPSDVLLVPHTAAETVDLITSEGARASAVMVLRGIDDGDWRAAVQSVAAIRQAAGAVAVVIADLDERHTLAWLQALFVALSHDQPLDIALAIAAEKLKLHPPVLFADTSCLDRGPVSSVAWALRGRLERAGLGRKEVPEHDLGPARLVAELEGLTFKRGSEGASLLAQYGPDLERRIEAAEPARYLQIGLSFDAAADVSRFVDLLLVGRKAWLHVRIGPDADGWAATKTALPVEDLAFADRSEELTVILIASALLDQPAVASIELPAVGPSTVCSFELPAPVTATPFEGTVLVLHQDRVLQIARIVAGCVMTDELVPDASKLHVEVELIRRSLQDLGSRRLFDASIVAGVGNESRTTLFQSGRAEFLAPEGLHETVKQIRRTLEEALTDEWGTTALRDRKVIELLIKLANFGEPLHRALLKVWDDPHVADARLLQVVAARPGAYLPLEFVYAGRAPAPTASLCAGAERGLAAGTCGPACPAGDSVEVVCPLGFWGLSKVVERIDYRRPPEHWEYAVLSEPTRARNRLDKPTGAIIGISDRASTVQNQAARALAASVDAATSGNAVTVDTWDEWVAEVQSRHPPMLVLVPHTAPDPFFGNMALEIGSGLLAVSQISVEHVCPSRQHHPVVLLLGCDTGPAPAPLEGFPAQFQDRGAALVLGTLTEVLGRNAAPVAGRIVTVLVERSAQQVAYFGEVVRDVRRRLLADGQPFGLTLVAYGDADWVFG